MPLTMSERESLVEHLTASRDRVLCAISGLTEDQWRFRPEPDLWSIAQCSEHVALTERTILKMISEDLAGITADPATLAKVEGKEELIRKAVPNRSRRVKTPTTAVDPCGTLSRQEVVQLLSETRQRTLAYVGTTEDDLHSRVAPHFILRELDGHQWMVMISLHTERHAAQIDEVKAAPGFPAV